jgi:hypothetical protein
MTLLKKSIMKDITRINHIVLNKHYKTPVNVRGRWVAHQLLLRRLILLVLPKNQKKGVENQRKQERKVANVPKVVELARDEDINKYQPPNMV